MGDVQMLLEMGFSKEKAEYAIKVTNNAGVEPAMEWLLAHADDEIPTQQACDNTAAAAVTTVAVAVADNNSTENKHTEKVPDEATVAVTASAMNESTAAPQIAKSLKCDDCGKILKNETEAEFHAVRTKHSNFSESTEEKPPLTEEEKRHQLVLLEEKLKQKRIEREERERRDELERERNRIKSGKDMTEARQRMEHLEMQKIVEQRKREKAEEKAARERVRAQIEADKAARKARQDRENPSDSAATKSPTTTMAATSTNSSPMVKKDYTHTRIQIRLQDGGVLTENFSIKEQLSAVRVFIQVKTGNVEPFGLMTTFPRKVFADDDYEKPLDALGLVPSAVVIMTKANADA